MAQVISDAARVREDSERLQAEAAALLLELRRQMRLSRVRLGLNRYTADHRALMRNGRVCQSPWSDLRWKRPIDQLDKLDKLLEPI